MSRGAAAAIAAALASIKSATRWPIIRRTVSLPSRCGLSADALFDPTHVLREERQRPELLERDQTGAQAVVDVVIVVGDLVGEVRELRLEAGCVPLEEALADVAELARVA